MNAEQILCEMLTGFNGDRDSDENFVARFKERVQNECEQLDGKACGLVWKRKDGTVEEGFFLLVPRDKVSVSLLLEYASLCCDVGCDVNQVDGVYRVIERFKAWQDANPDKMKTPDLKEGDNAL